MADVAVSVRQEKETKLFQECSVSWNVKNLKSGSVVKFPEFFPIPNSDVSFHFELWFQNVGENVQVSSIFKMMMVKSGGSNITKSMKMDVTNDVSGIGSDGISLSPLFKHHRCADSIYDMHTIFFPVETKKWYILKGKNYNPTNFFYLNKNVYVIRCDLKFYDHLNTPEKYIRNLQSLDNLKNFANDFESIYQPSVLNDILFKIGNESLPAHKAVLAAHSPVFLKMMTCDFLESESNTVVINDSSPEIFGAFLNYFYKGDIEDKSLPTAMELLALADKYDVRTLKRRCGAIISTFLCNDNVCDILKISCDYGDDRLKEEAKIYFAHHAFELVQKEAWKEFIASNPIIGSELMMNFVSKVLHS